MEYWRLYKFRKRWRKLNPHNFTTAKNIFCPVFVHVGRYSYGVLRVLQSNYDAHLYVGNFCSIADDVLFVLNSEHNIKNISTYPFKVKWGKTMYEAGTKGDIVVGDDVWIGTRATILSGVKIGQGAVIAAGAVVAKDVPPYAVVGGVPAKILHYRFSDDLIDELLKVDYAQLDESVVEKHIEDLYRCLSDAEQLAWLPKK